VPERQSQVQRRQSPQALGQGLCWMMGVQLAPQIEAAAGMPECRAEDRLAQPPLRPSMAFALAGRRERAQALGTPALALAMTSWTHPLTAEVLAMGSEVRVGPAIMLGRHVVVSWERHDLAVPEAGEEGHDRFSGA